MKYTGDTPSKKIARLAVWKRVKEILGARFFTGSHLVLLSSEAGDISTLLGLGVHASHIIGVDSDKHAVDAAKFRFDDVRCIKGDVADVARQLKSSGTKFVSAYLDFCGPMRENTIGKTIEVTKSLDKKAAVAITVKMGREQGKWADAVNAAKSTITTGSGTFYLRTDLLTTELLERGRRLGNWVMPQDFYRCSSLKATEEKSEMLICVGQLQPATEGNLKALANKIGRDAFYSTVAADERAIGPLASLLASREEDAHLLLNLRRESVNAYLAHRTRGTYEGRYTGVNRHRRKV